MVSCPPSTTPSAAPSAAVAARRRQPPPRQLFLLIVLLLVNAAAAARSLLNCHQRRLSFFLPPRFPSRRRLVAPRLVDTTPDAAATTALPTPSIHRQLSVGSISAAVAFNATTAASGQAAAPVAVNASSPSSPPLPPPPPHVAGTTSGDSMRTAALEARVKQLEETIRTLKKGLEKLEGSVGSSSGKGKAVGGILQSWRSKTVVISYDVGPDASIDSIDIAVAAAAAFGLLGMLVGRSLAHNLWLVCGIASAVLAGSLAREEEGGALADVVRAVGFELALKSRQFFFMYRTGRLAYAYNRKWESLDRRYQLKRRFEAVKELSLKKWREAEEAEKKYQLRYRLSSALKATYNGAIDVTASLFNAKDRKELVKKLPKPLRYLFMSKAQRRMEERRRVRVTRFVGLRDGRPIVEVGDED